MRKLLIYLGDYKKETVLAPLFKMLEASFELLIPLIMAQIIDGGIADADRGFILQMCLLMTVLGIIGLVCSVTAQFYAAKAAVGFSADLKHALFQHIQSLSFSEIDAIGTPTLITRLTSDVNQVQSGINLVLRLFLRSPFIVLGAMVMAFTIDVWAALVFVVAIPLLCLAVFGIMLISMPLYRRVQGGLDRILGMTRETLTGARVIRAFCREEEEIRQFQEQNKALSRMQMFVGRISALMNPVTCVIVNGGVMALVWSGALRVEGGYLTQGEVIALVSYMSQILTELIKLANLIITVTKAFACGDRLQAVLETEPGMQAGRGSGQAEAAAAAGQRPGSAGRSPAEEQEEAVCFDHVCLTYQGAGAEALTDISFRVKRGQTVGIIGGTGSGKSSLVSLIPRFYDATKGSVRIHGVDVREYSLKELRERIGMVMQKAVLFQGSIRENLLWGKQDASEDEMWEALETAQAREFVEAKEGGLDAPVAQGGKNLSGGQRQRLTIARALVRKPDILILDDSASALDLATDARLRRAIRELEDDPAVFIVSQRTASVLHADLIIVLEDGRIAGLGTHKELLETCRVYREIHDSQFKKEGRHDGR
ncbi:MAG: ABC transporter ATP-binding protein/permease [Lachnospiraceae bacterium]|nr:ABC transporter ATP-binding protein/permease [Lachnospiraceae bacterium]